jgi:hypothetical protein
MKTTGNGSIRSGWVRRAAVGTALAALGMLTLGAASKPAEAYSCIASNIWTGQIVWYHDCPDFDWGSDDGWRYWRP